jgi:hypothetical protein
MSMADSSHQSGEVAASVAAVTDVLDHLTVATHQVHSAIARRGFVGVLPTPVRSAQDAVTAAVYGTVRAGIALAGRTATLTLESVERTQGLDHAGIPHPEPQNATTSRILLLEDPDGDRIVITGPLGGN